MSKDNPFQMMNCLVKRPPQAVAAVRGSSTYSEIFGRVFFYQMDSGVIVVASVMGLPKPTLDFPNEIFGFHIHSGSQCSGREEDPFADALAHYNPNGAPHPDHAGDLPPLFGNHGYAFQVFFTNRFSVRQVIHRTVIIHSGPDDFTSQPAGNVGEKIACGRIEAFNRY